MVKLLKKGAEASIYLGKWLEEAAIFKIRKVKSYRPAILDSKIRGSRTLHEASFLANAKRLGLTTPLIYFVDIEHAEIVMQFISGMSLKEVIDSAEEKSLDIWCREVGRYIARLHNGKIIHGDLNTSNLIVNDDNLVLIDFGLSFHSNRIEDKAVDLHLLNKAAQSAHNVKANSIIESVLDGYKEVSGEDPMNDVVNRMKEVEQRGRYKRVE